MSENRKEIKLEAVGWKLWLVLTAVSYPPAFWVSYGVCYEDMKDGMLPWILGFFLSAFGAGVITTALNTVLQNRVEKIRSEERKSNKKNKKKK